MQHLKTNAGKWLAIVGPLLALAGFLGKIILDIGEQRAHLDRSLKDIATLEANCATKDNLNTFKEGVTERFKQGDVIDTYLRDGLIEITTVVKVKNRLGEYSATGRPRSRVGTAPPAEVAKDALEQHEETMQRASRDAMQDPLKNMAF